MSIETAADDLQEWDKVLRGIGQPVMVAQERP
jgi:hypothetical protein